jgi:hypothetical protein
LIQNQPVDMAASPPGHWSRLRGCTYSECCDKCTAGSDTLEAALRRQHAAAGGAEEAPRRMVCCIAGDIKGIETLAGNAGPSGTYNCVMCECRLHQTYVAGVPHLRVLPEPWASKDIRAPEIIDPPPRGGTAETNEYARRYAEAKGAPNAPKNLSSADFKSCDREALFRSNDFVEQTSCTPLHVTLGLGTNYLKAVEHRCGELDADWAVNVSDKVLLKSWEDAQAEAFTLTEAHDEAKAEIASMETGIEMLVSVDPTASKTGRIDAYRDDQRDAGKIRYRKMKDDLKKLVAAQKKAAAAVTKAESAEAAIKETLLKQTDEGAGPFGKRFRKLLLDLKISMKKYFGGTYIGPDLHKIFGITAHIRLLCDLLKRGHFEMPDGTWKHLGSDDEADALFSCLRPFGELHQLFNRKEPLCEHEIVRFPELVVEHAIAFATVFPTVVPTLKMHILSMHMSEVLERHGSIGMDTEQGIECYHPEVTYVMNKFRSMDRRPEAQMAAVAKQCWARGAGKRASAGEDVRAAQHARTEKQRMVVKIEKSNQ